LETSIAAIKTPACQSLGALTRRALHRGRERRILPGRLRRGCRSPEKGVFSTDELLSALRRYLAESGDTEEEVASRIGVNHHTLRRYTSAPSTSRITSHHQPQYRFELGDPADRDKVRPSRLILPERGIQNGARRAGEHEIALLDAGGQKLRRIFVGHL
jgi:hypothetical protein